MSKSERNYLMYLEDMHEAMSRIEEYIEGYSFINFKKDYKTVDAVIRNFEIMEKPQKTYLKS